MNSLPPSAMSSIKPSQLQELLSENKNGLCADCGKALSVETAWSVLSYGICVCDDCKLVHIEQENHFKGLEQTTEAESSVTGILPTAFPQLWNEKDMEQMRSKGNENVNARFLGNVPAWLYRPTAHDGIKHKEYWIKYKYSARIEEGEEVPKIAGKSFIGIQFTRPMPKGNYPCCAVLQNDKLYLTSDVKNEEIQIENIETVLLNSKRIGRENGVQLTYRTNGSGSVASNGVTYTYLQHDNMETVLDWINLVLYTKYNLLKKKYSSYSPMAIANMLNCAMVKESYMTASSHGLVYVSLSEARLACFQHHLDDKPLFHLPITKALKFTGCQYLDAVANFFSLDVGKIYGYDEWNSCLEFALSLDKLGYLGDEIVKPVNTIQLLPPKKPTPSPMPFENEPSVKEITKDVPQKVVTTAPVTSLVNTDIHNNGTVEKEFFKDERGAEKPNDKSARKSYECYPPIGPMGEMGKVARGELPPEAIKPPPPKNNQMFSLMTHAGTMAQGTHAMMASPPIAMNNSLSQPTTIRQNNSDCYPPISGPVRDMMKPNDMFAHQTHISRDDGYPVIDEFKPHNSMNSTYRGQDSNYAGKLSGNAFNDSEMNPYSRMTLNGWMNETDNILTVPWKQTRNGYEPTRVYQQGPNYDSWNDPKLTGMRSPTDIPSQQVSLARSASWNPSASGRTMEQWPMKQQPEQYFAQKPTLNRSSVAAGGTEHIIMENLQQQWSSAERKLLTLIHNGYVPASNMAAAGLDANSVDHAQTCITELFELLWKQRYDLALSFLRGFREVFSRSLSIEIRNRFIGVGELDTMKQIFLQQGREKFIRANSGGPVTWKQASPSPTSLDQAWPTSTANTNTTSAQQDSPTDFTPWGPMLPLTPSDIGISNLWGSTPATPVGRVSSDPWNSTVSITSSQSTIGTNGSQSFNRAPSRPVSLTRSSMSENSPTEGSFGSKTSSNSSASPGVITPPASLDSCMTSAALTGIETTLKNLFLNSNASGSSLWN